MNVEPYLCVGGYEIMNALRTETYIRRGLAGPEWSACVVANPVAGALPYSVPVDDLYVDLYVDLYGGSSVTHYRQDFFTPQNICGYCAAYDFSADMPTFNYLSPADDDAPWYLAAHPDSADFLGLLLSTAELTSVLSRAVTATGPVGGGVGRLLPRQRILGVSALMFASSACGMAWGERWLTDVLSGNLCDDVTDLVDVVLLPCCPDPDATDSHFRTLKRAGIVDGPIFSELGHDSSIPACHAQRVDFQLASELPWLMADPSTLASAHASVGLPLSAEVSTEEWVGDAGVVVTIEPTNDFAGTITVTPLPQGYACPTAGLPPAEVYTVTGLPRGHTWTFDSAARLISEWDVTAKAYTSGMPRLSALGGFAWLEIPPCSRVCVTVTVMSGTADVTIAQVNREL